VNCLNLAVWERLGVEARRSFEGAIEKLTAEKRSAPAASLLTCHFETVFQLHFPRTQCSYNFRFDILPHSIPILGSNARTRVDGLALSI